MERFADAFSTTLTTAISTTARPVAFSVAAGSAQLPGGTFAIIIYDAGTDAAPVNAERLMVTAVSTLSYTATTEVGDTAKLHATNSVVRQIVTARSLTQQMVDHKDPVIEEDPHTQYIRKSGFAVLGDLLVATASAAFSRLARGTNGYVLTADDTQTTGLKWAAIPGFSGIMTMLGDLVMGGASGIATRLGIGTAGQVLTAVQNAATITTPVTAPTLAAGSSGGTLVDTTTYHFRYVWSNGTDPAGGDTVASPSASLAATSSGRIDVTCPAAPAGTTNLYVYIGTASSPTYLAATVAAPSTGSPNLVTISAPPNTGNAQPSSTNTTGGRSPAWAAGGGGADPTTTRGQMIRRGATVLEAFAVGANNTILGSNGTDPDWTAAPVVSGQLTALDLKASGMAGAANSIRWVGGNASGPPATGTWLARDGVVNSDGTIWICLVAGTPGTWTQISGTGGGAGGTGFATLTVGDMWQETRVRGTSNKTTTSTTFVVIDNSNLPALGLTLKIGDIVRCKLSGMTTNTSPSNVNYFDFRVEQPTLGTTRVNSTAVSGALGVVAVPVDSIYVSSTFTATESGAHAFQPMWRVSAGTGTLYNDSATADTDTAIEFTVEKIGAVLAQPYVCMLDRKTAGTEGGTFTAGAWRTRDLTVEFDDTHAIASLASSQVTLPAGRYETTISVPAYSCNSHVARLQDITGVATLLTGSAARSPVGQAMDRSIIAGSFTLTVSSILEVQHSCESTRATDGFGISAAVRVNPDAAYDIYTVAEFRKTA